MVTAAILADVGDALVGVVALVLVPLAVLGLVAYGIWELVRSAGPRPAAVVTPVAGPPPGTYGSVPDASPARALLDERFARGEIDGEEYVTRRNLLDGVVPPSAPPVVDPSTTEVPPVAPAPAEGPATQPAADPADPADAAAPSDAG